MKEARRLIMPDRIGVFASLLILTIGTAFGGFFGRYQGDLYRMLENAVTAHASAHHLSGNLEQDSKVIEKARSNFRGKLVRFHNHANGLALAIFIVSLVIANIELSVKIKKIITWAISLGGVTYPFGWLVTGLSIGTMGVEKAQKMGELILVPSGTIVILSLVGTLGIYLFKEVKHRARS